MATPEKGSERLAAIQNQIQTLLREIPRGQQAQVVGNVLLGMDSAVQEEVNKILKRELDKRAAALTQSPAASVESVPLAQRQERPVDSVNNPEDIYVQTVNRINVYGKFPQGITVGATT